ncbi:putative cytochrome P450 monooxygenase [Lineolata rhizophorae]|uniref:Putative cytochrome P450 monooxygenase n=1 Tax=Lineolata rhizophorae TaxID=578093 RepID=A0A6A6P9R5_9PEZI|nr:putative cytochrome P450 monooxygenase [Lineolata rhizophorae]
MSLPLSIYALAAVFFSFVLYKYILYPAFLSPLAAIPNANPTSAISPLWILWTRFKQRENVTVHSAHKRLGPIVRLGPNEIGVNCVKGGLLTVYAGGFEKSDWYPNLFCNYGMPNMFSTVQSRPHSVRKRMISNTYSKSYLHSSPTMSALTAQIIHRRLLPLLATHASSSTPVNAFPLFSAATLDIVTSYIFGLRAGTDYLTDSASLEAFLDRYESRRAYTFWPQELPRLTSWLETWLGLRVVPRWVDEANRQIEALGLHMLDRAEELLRNSALGQPIVSAGSPAPSAGSQKSVPSFSTEPRLSAIPPADVPVVYAQLRAAMVRALVLDPSSGALSMPPDASPARGPLLAPYRSTVAQDDSTRGDTVAAQLRLELASEMLDHWAAGFDTSGITLTYLAWELSKNPEVQDALRKELRGLPAAIYPRNKRAANGEKDVSAAQDELVIPDSKLLDQLPLLNAVLQETLRLHAAIPGGQPRVTPTGGCKLGAYEGIPGGVRVNAQAYSLHRNEQVFPNAEEWRPQRWLSNETTKGGGDMNRWFWAFGSGGRMCVGSNLAIFQMKYIIAAIYTGFRTSIIDDEGIEQVDAYTAPPKGGKLVLTVESVA